MFKVEIFLSGDFQANISSLNTDNTFISLSGNYFSVSRRITAPAASYHGSHQLSEVFTTSTSSRSAFFFSFCCSLILIHNLWHTASSMSQQPADERQKDSGGSSDLKAFRKGKAEMICHLSHLHLLQRMNLSNAGDSLIFHWAPSVLSASSLPLCCTITPLDI